MNNWLMAEPEVEQGPGTCGQSARNLRLTSQGISPALTMKSGPRKTPRVLQSDLVIEVTQPST